MRLQNRNTFEYIFKSEILFGNPAYFFSNKKILILCAMHVQNESDVCFVIKTQNIVFFSFFLKEFIFTINAHAVVCFLVTQFGCLFLRFFFI